MSQKKKASGQAAATQKISKDELEALIKKAEEEDPDAASNVDAGDLKRPSTKSRKK